MSVTLDLPFPAKALWPNGRAHWAVKSKAVKAHRNMSCVGALVGGAQRLKGDRFAIALTVHPKTRNAIDRDNCIAASKAYLDGIADAMGVDDQCFDAPTVTFGEPVKGGAFKITVTPRGVE